MQQATTTSPSTSRLGLWLGVAAALGGLAAYLVQVFVVHSLITPWYAPVLATLGVVLIAAATFRRPGIARGLVLALFTVVAVFEWSALLVFTQLPAYAGPARVGEPLPAFTTTLADGATLTDADLRGDPAVLLFFRGRW